MHRLFVSLALPAAVVVVAACTASRSPERPSPANYTKNLGSASAHDLAQKTRQLLQRYQYEIEVEETASPNYYLLRTRWHGRYPLQDELKRGVVAAMTRITVRGRTRRRAAGGSPGLMVAVFSAENMIRLADSLAWQHGIMTPMFEQYVEEIAERLKTELEQGIRVF